jgi:hypothetical protein
MRRLLLIALWAVSARADAQPAAAPERRIELWGALGRAGAGPHGVLESSYSPPLLLDGDFTSHAGQTLTIDTGPTLALAGGVNLFVLRRVGLQIAVDRASHDVSGSNGAYALRLQYVSRLPPDDRPQPVDVNTSVGWPDTRGSVTELVLGFNAIVRVDTSDRFDVIASGGPVVYRLSGNLRPVAYTAFQLGGHSVLFEDDYRLVADAAPAYGVGFNVGADLSVPMARRVALTIGFRYVHGGDATVSVAPAGILNPDQVTFAQPLEAIATRLGLPAMRVSASGSRMLVGVKVMP